MADVASLHGGPSAGCNAGIPLKGIIMSPAAPAPAPPDSATHAVRSPVKQKKQKGRLVLLGALCTAGWAASLLVGHYVECGPELHRIGLAVHILALVLSFGTILVVDWLGLLWLLGKVQMHESGKLEAAAKPLIWGGLALLLTSGALIDPDLTNPVTVIKLGCVLVLMLNGLSIAPAMHQLLALPAHTRFGELGRRLRLRLMVALSISQACWWTAVLIGLINSTLRRWAGV
ncbi:hypothetical protein [Arthrobacter globiformis]|uniref:hypothetical protein n=1 Tax=Arthrobacter globiformis TaxID=1665 RepID=UPI002793BBC5|nr:hypothetical protein [Arthrobacter globiformis]MDQ0620162.1 hypothetical protein [Arthrobacter globiformis]